MPPVVAVDAGRHSPVDRAGRRPAEKHGDEGRQVGLEPRLAGEEDRARHRRDNGPGQVQDVVDERDLVADEVRRPAALPAAQPSVEERVSKGAASSTTSSRARARSGTAAARD